jgi:hypothetical protein
MIYEDDIMMTSLNGLTRPWDAFIQTVCAIKEKIQSDNLWEECAQEEARVLREDEDQALVSHSKKGRGKRETHFHKETHSHKVPHSPKKF